MELQKLIDDLKNHRNGAASYESVDEAIRVFETMRDMDGEKVRKGLECCIASNGSYCPDECPYENICLARKGTQDIYVHLMEDALALIRQQQERIKELEEAHAARVMSLEEIKDGESYWLSVGKEFVTRPVICVHREDDARKPYITFVWQFGTFSWDAEDYGKTWHCWTQRPTEAQL